LKNDVPTFIFHRPYHSMPTRPNQTQTSQDIHSCWSKSPYPGTAILCERKRYFRETFANFMLIFRGNHVWQQRLFKRFVHHLPNYAQSSRITSW
jgi:hypothetical protein